MLTTLQDNLDAIIGDLDSLTDESRVYFESSTPSKDGTEVVHDPDQYSTDFGKAVTYVRAQHGAPVDIVAVGGLGGRVDQGLSQLHHLYLFQTHPRYDKGRMYLFSGESLTFLLKTGHHQIRVREDDQEDVFEKYVGILPMKEPSRITTKGLEWDVTDWHTEFGGMVSTSNHVLPETKLVEVYTTKDVLFTIAMRQI
jgi:thiamine pyrophosphokinase